MATKAASQGAGKGGVKKVVLAYSGGLDTSIILKWLQSEYGCEVITFTADLGQGEELGPAREKALKLGIKPENIFIEDLREEFVRDFVFPMFRANAVYEGVYLLGTSIARPLIGKTQIDIARRTGADAVCHGATGKGNDQVRFELTYYALEPGIKIIAPWREWAFKGRAELLEFARTHDIPIAKGKENDAPYSVDANLLHSSSEGKVLEDPAIEAPPMVYQRTISPMEAPDKATDIKVGFKQGDAVSINGKPMSPATLLTALNKLGHDNGIGRIDLVENRFVGMKSRGVYETPGGTILLRGAQGDREHHPRPRRGAPQGRHHAALRGADLQRLLVLAGARDAAGPDRQEPGARRGRGLAQALQGQRHRHRPVEPEVALFLDPRHLRGRQGRLRPEGRPGLHQAECAAPAHTGGEEGEDQELSPPLAGPSGLDHSIRIRSGIVRAVGAA